MNPVGRLLLRTSAAVVLAAMLAAPGLCADASAATSPPLMTYITDLDKPAP